MKSFIRIRKAVAITCSLAVVALFAGCLGSLEDQGKKTGSVIGKKTKEIGEFDPKANQKVSDSKVRVKDPYFYALEAYRPMVEQLNKGKVAHALNLYYAEHEKYPKDHAEFMEKIIKPNNIQLEALPEGYKYKYDVENHRLEVVKPLDAPADAAK